jgi:hypothetical protein
MSKVDVPRRCVINVSVNVSPKLRLQDDVYTLLVCGSTVLHSECYLSVTENLEQCDERSFFFTVNGEAD